MPNVDGRPDPDSLDKASSPTSQDAHKIPTTLKEKGKQQTEERASSSHVDAKEDIDWPHSKRIVIEVGEYHCRCRDHIGKLCVTSEGVRFQTAVRSKELWKLGYEELKGIHKVSHGTVQ